LITTVVNIRKTKEYDVYIGRPSPFGNPFIIGKDGTRDEVVAKYRPYFYRRMARDMLFRAAVHSLAGKVLGCYCKPKPCHGDVIAEYLDRPMRVLEKSCPNCGGDIYTSYKYGKLWKCVKCSMVFPPGRLKVPKEGG